MTVLVFLIAAVILFFFIAKQAKKKQNENKQKTIELGYSIDSKVITGKYISGHPDLNDPILITAIYSKDDYLDIVLDVPFRFPEKKAQIEKRKIRNVLVEDESTMERRVTVGRLLVVGVFAFALKKKKKNELAYLTFEWNDGTFDHETIFEFEGKNAMQRANTARNQIIKLIR